MKNNNYIKIAKKAAAIQSSELKKINKTFDKNFIKLSVNFYKSFVGFANS